MQDTEYSKYGYKYMKKAGRKHPDHLVDSFKCLSVNQIAAGLVIMDFFLLPTSFLNMFSVNTFKQAIGPIASVLQTFSL